MRQAQMLAVDSLPVVERQLAVVDRQLAADTPLTAPVPLTADSDPPLGLCPSPLHARQQTPPHRPRRF